jgi:putative ABC transport system permease protein
LCMIGWLRDVRYACRILRASPGFTSVALASIVISIGANVGGFGLVNALVWRELPVRDPGQLAEISMVGPSGARTGLSFPAYRELARAQSAFTALVAWTGAGARNLETRSGILRAETLAVTGNFHAELGVTPAAGRLLRPEDDQPGAPLVAVLGHGFWQRALQGDPAIVGRSVRLETTPVTIVGIAPPGFKGLGIVIEPDITIPLNVVPQAFDAAKGLLENAGAPWLSITGRLGPGTSVEQAAANLDGVWPSVQTAVIPPNYAGRQRDQFFATRLAVRPASRGSERHLRAQFTRPLFVVFGIAGLTLLIACINLGGLLYSRAATRISEMTIRLALGASRWELARQQCAESAVLAVLGALGGAALGYGASHAIQNLILQNYGASSALNVSPDWRTYVYMVALTTVVTLLVSAAPVWLVTRRDVCTGIAQPSRTVTRSGRAGRMLIVLQLGLSLVLLVNAGLLVRTLLAMRAIDTGYARDAVMTAALIPRPGGYRALVPDQYYPELLRRLAAINGVRAVALSKNAPATPADFTETVSSISENAAAAGVTSLRGQISPGFFSALEIQLMKGRDFNWRDDGTSSRVAIVSASLAARLFPHRDAVGGRIRLGTKPGQPEIEVVGVASDARLYDPKNPNPFAVYVPMLQAGGVNYNSTVVRCDRITAGIVGQIRQEVRGMNREDLVDIRSLSEVYDRTIVRERVTAMIAGFFGAVALLLAAVGLFSVMSYLVGQRIREFGVRMALGATRTGILTMVLRDTSRLLFWGIALGLPIALISVRLVAGLLVGVEARDPLTLLIAAATLIAVGALAGLGPARRASSLAPTEALRQ